MHPIPPLNSLRAFEAAARHLSMSKAAEELHVTPAAVSHQVKGLEEFVQRKLFHRDQKGLRLTEAGAAYLPGLTEAFKKIHEATDGLLGQDKAGPLTLSVTSTFAAKWLVHRLEKFTLLHPEIQVMLVASALKVRFDEGEADLAVRFGPGVYPGCQVEKLFEEEVFPVCAPHLLEGKNAIREPADLLKHTLLHPVQHEVDDSFPTWQVWLRGHGVRTEDPVPGPNISPHWMLVEAAAAGQGVALAKATVAEADLEAGRIVRPFHDAVHVNHGYWLIAPDDIADAPKVRAFRDWILGEAEEHAREHARIEAQFQEQAKRAKRAGTA